MGWIKPRIFLINLVVIGLIRWQYYIYFIFLLTIKRSYVAVKKRLKLYQKEKGSRYILFYIFLLKLKIFYKWVKYVCIF